MTPDPTFLDAADFAAHDAWLRRLARHLVADEDAARDLTQETWLRALEHRPDPGRPLRAWLTVVARSVAAFQARGQANRARRERAAAAPELVLSSEHAVQRTEAIRRLIDALLGLPEPYRSALILRFQEGLSNGEIAQRQGVAEGTVRWRIHQGLDMLRALLGEEPDQRRGLLALVIASPALPRTAGAAALAGGLLMSGKALLGSAAVLAVLLMVGWIVIDRPPEDPVVASQSPATGSGTVEQAVSPPASPDVARQALPETNQQAPSETPASSGSVCRVTNRRGDPIAGARVRVLVEREAQTLEPSGESAETDESGRCRVSRTSEFVLLVEADGYSPTTERIAQITPGGAFGVVLWDAAVLHGRVLEYETLRPIAGALILFGESVNDAWGDLQWCAGVLRDVITAADGSYRFESFPVGVQTPVTVVREGFADAYRQVLHTGDEAYDLLVPRGRTVQGRVFDVESGLGLAGATLSELNVTTDASGGFQVGGVTAQTPVFRVSAPGYCTTVLVTGLGDLADDRTLPVPLIRTVRLHGRLVDERGQARGGVRIRIPLESAREALVERFPQLDQTGLWIHPLHDEETVTGPDGRFRFDGLAAFAPVAVVVCESERSRWWSARCSPGAGEGEVLIAPLPRATLQGRVTQQGHPVEAALSWRSKANAWNRGAARCDAAGRFRIDDVVAGEVELLVGPESVAVAAEARPLVLQAGEERWIEVDLKHEPQVFAGTVVDLDGAPVEGCEVLVGEVATWTGADGTFRLEFQAPPRDCWPVRLQLGLPFGWRFASAHSGDESLTFVFPRIGVIALRVRDADHGRTLPRFLVRWRSLDNGIEAAHGVDTLTAVPETDGIVRLRLPEGRYALTLDASLLGYPEHPVQDVKSSTDPDAPPLDVLLRRSD